ncbi:unnamed protein product [Cuscuta europaea]|uniref:Reverse transcriptase zinc-binding domain-containing protein n=1 Tax=Cuscuta europaea TaxID=41803 RepID=A0A9P0Z5Z6_CUSEU|nr:unnamed protein product [Cuscuta europaea]
MDLSLPSFANLERKGVPIQNICKACVEGAEDSDHALRCCPRAAEVWSEAGVDIGSKETSLKDWLQEVPAAPYKERRCKGAMLTWRLWKHRNAFVWENDWQNTASVILATPVCCRHGGMCSKRWSNQGAVGGVKPRAGNDQKREESRLMWMRQLIASGE